ncbi:MAG: Fic family protein [Planctomycetota bacterium]
MRQVGPTIGGRYLHWDDLRRRKAPDELNHEAWWYLIKGARERYRREVPLKTEFGRPFYFSNLDEILEAEHRADGVLLGNVGVLPGLLDTQHRDRYLQRSLVEEAISSSQIEGATTTRHVAKDMILKGRAPRDRHERMIVNNYRAMEAISDLVDRPLTVELLCDLHRTVTEGTLDDERDAGRLRTTDDIVVGDALEVDVVYHRPPPAVSLPERLDRLCHFANGASETGFLHPMVRAIVLHFMIGYEHPFVDGNGRTARALFYWSIRRSGYWLFEFLSISTLIKNAKSRYERAFLLTETDEFDLTYFILHQIDVIRRATGDLDAYLKRKEEERKDADRLLARRDDLNHRQRDLVVHALRHPGTIYTIAEHKRKHRVVYQTARTDLLDLVERGFLESWRTGKALQFRAPVELPKRLRP